MKQHFSILNCLELILKGFSSPVLLMSCPQGPFGSWKFDFFDFFKPFVRLSCPQGPFGSWKFDFFQPIIHPYSPLFALICPYLLLFTLNYPSQGPNLPLFTPNYPGAAALFTLIYPYAGALFTLIYPYAGALFTLIYP